MNAVKILAIVLIVAGVLGLVYGSFSYTKSTHEAKLGPDRAVGKGQADGQRARLGGVGGIVVGGALLLFFKKKELAPASEPSESSAQGFDSFAAQLTFGLRGEEEKGGI